jgi:hypothetical protein
MGWEGGSGLGAATRFGCAVRRQTFSCGFLIAIYRNDVGAVTLPGV